jgi:hypothetical protein
LFLPGIQSWFNTLKNVIDAIGCIKVAKEENLGDHINP